MQLRQTTRNDFLVLLGWVRTRQDMVMWSGPTFTWPLDVAQLEKRLTDGRRIWWTGVDPESGKMAGCVSLLLDHDAQSMRIGYIITDPAIRGQGRGRSLVEAAVARSFEMTNFPALTLGVYSHNSRAIRLYQSLGFTPTGFTFETVVDDATWCAEEMRIDKTSWKALHP